MEPCKNRKSRLLLTDVCCRQIKKTENEWKIEDEDETSTALEDEKLKRRASRKRLDGHFDEPGFNLISMG